jgi:hypothetical protein
MILQYALEEFRRRPGSLVYIHPARSKQLV